jgi:hypothetical protein
MSRDAEDLGANRLRPYERHVACILGALLLTLSYLSIPKGVAAHSVAPITVSVHIVGAVRETRLLVPLGSTVDDLLQQVELDAKADIVEVDGNRKFMKDDILVIPFKGLLTLYVKGCVLQPQVLVFDMPTNASKILSKAQLLETADCARFMRRRVFKTGMVVEIPEKKIKCVPGAELVR